MAKRLLGHYSLFMLVRVNLRCRHCLELGLAAFQDHPAKNLVAVYGRFHSESGRAPEPLIVCDHSDTFQEMRAA